MNEQLNFNDIINLLTAKKQIDKNEAEQFLHTFFNLLRKEIPTKHVVTLDNLGTFSLQPVTKKETMQENLVNEDKASPCFEFQFLPSKALKEIVNKPFSHFEATPLHDDVVLRDISEETLCNDNSEVDNFNNTVYFFEQPKESEAALSEKNQPFSGEAQQTIEIIEETLQTSHISDKKEIEHKTTTSTENRPKDNSIKTDLTRPFVHHKRKNPGVLITGLSAILLLSASVFVYFQWRQRHKKKMPIAHHTLVEAKNVKAVKPTSEGKKKPVAIPFEKVTLKRGQTLRLLALEKFGHRDFWIYIYFENKARIKNPNRLPLNFELIVPNATKYGIDVNDSASITKAKQLSDEILKNY